MDKVDISKHASYWQSNQSTKYKQDLDVEKGT